MQTTQTVHQARWQELVNDPSLHDLPYKVETNERGQLILSPHSNRHSDYRGDVAELLSTHLEGGKTRPEFAISTSSGVKAPDVIWVSLDRKRKMDRTGDPTTLAPEVCVEVMSPTNTMAEMHDKRALYLEAGAEEVWVVEEDGTVRFFADEELDASRLAPDFPDKLPGARPGKV